MKTVDVCKTNGCLGSDRMCRHISDTTCECRLHGNQNCDRKVKVNINGEIPITFRRLEKH